MIDSFMGDFFFLSNFFPCEIWYEGLRYGSVEAAYQAAKTLDQNKRLTISQLPPTRAKHVGRRVELRPGWEKMKVDVMWDLLFQKFITTVDTPEGPRFMANQLTRLLAMTGDEELVEGNTWGDKFWGVCGGEGKNQLGNLLMMLRDFLVKPGKTKYLELQKSLDEVGTGQMRCFGDSMEPVLHSGSLMHFQKLDSYQIGDVVFCKIARRHFIDAHLITDIHPRKGYLISNYYGHDNGWTRKIYGKAVKAELMGKIYWEAK